MYPYRIIYHGFTVSLSFKPVNRSFLHAYVAFKRRVNTISCFHVLKPIRNRILSRKVLVVRLRNGNG
jgi:hypothetical protein